MAQKYWPIWRVPSNARAMGQRREQQRHHVRGHHKIAHSSRGIHGSRNHAIQVGENVLSIHCQIDGAKFVTSLGISNESDEQQPHESRQINNWSD